MTNYKGNWKSKIYSNIGGTYTLNISENKDSNDVEAILELAYEGFYKDGESKTIEMEGIRKNESGEPYSSLLKSKYNYSYVLRQKNLEHSQYFILKFNVKDDKSGGYLTCVFPADYVHLLPTTQVTRST